jgi:Zn-dependent protease with chaperone function
MIRLARAWATCLLLAATLAPVVALAAGEPDTIDAGVLSTPAREASPDSSAADTLQHSAAAEPLPTARDYLAEMRANFTPENRAYSNLKVAIRFLEPVYALLVGLLVLFSGFSADLRNVAHAMGRRRWVRVLVFLALYTLVVFVATFPVVWYDGFVVEHRFGLSQQSFGGWLGDQGKELMVSVFSLGVVPVLWLVYTLIARSRRWWWLWVGLAALPLIVGGTLIEPLVVDPLFNKFTPLEDHRLEARILDLAARAGIPGRNVYQVNKSEQTNKYNAYVNGFGVSQRIVLWDTTLRGMNEDEILFVMGHEMGHYVLRHIWKGIAFSWLGSVFMLWLTSRIAERLVARFAGRWGFDRLDDVASLPLLSLLISLLAFVGQPAVNGMSRQVESEADVYGLEITRDNDAAARAFLKLGSQNKSNPEPSTFVRLVLYSHPSLSERVKLAMSYRPWEHGEPNRFYRPRAEEGMGAP